MKRHETLARLVKSGLCTTGDTASHFAELQRLALEKAELSESERIGRLHKALGEGVRIRILRILSEREMCVCEIMAALDMTQPNASHHLKILEQEGLVRSRRDGKWVFYGISDSVLLSAMRSIGLF